MALGPGPIFLSELGLLLALAVALSPVVPIPPIAVSLAPCSHGIWLSVSVALTLTPKRALWDPASSLPSFACILPTLAFLVS